MNLIIIIFLSLFLSGTGEKQNVLFIIIDDLRPALGCYGDKNAYTPNIDNLAKNSIIFTQAYAQQSLCAPSRNSLLTARRPDTLRLYDFYSYWRDVAGNFTTMPEYFKYLGYKTMSVGKVFHPGISSNGSDDSPYSWSEKPFHPFTNSYKNAAVCPETSNNHLFRNLICPVQISKMPNKTLPDIEIFNKAKSFLRNSIDQQPFFMAVGFEKPHIPFKYPKKYLKFHPLNKFKLHNYFWPENLNPVAYNPWNDIRKREDVKSLNLKFPWQKIPEKFARRIIQSYYSAVTYIDDLIGRLLNELLLLNLTKNTLIIITSDHGWSLGEHAEWAKYSNFDVALRVPLIISIPNLTFDMNSTKSKFNCFSNKFLLNYTGTEKIDISNTNKLINKNRLLNYNGKINEVVELIDLFPTISELVGYSIPICSTHDNFSKEVHHKNNNMKLCSEGLSFLSLIKSPLRCQNNTWKNFAFSQYPRPGIEPTVYPSSDEPKLKNINIMGYTLRTEQFRYTAWVKFNHHFIEPDWNEIIAEELYDHDLDFRESINVANNSEYLKQKQILKKIIQKGWTSKI